MDSTIEPAASSGQDVNTSELLQRHASFWNGTLESPLIAELTEPTWGRMPYPLTGGRSAKEPYRLEPDDYDISRVLGEDLPLPPLVTADYVHGIRPRYPVTFIESVIGCPVYASDTSCYSRPPIGETNDPLLFNPLSLDRSWLSILDDVLDREIILANRKYPALQLHLRGVVDMLAAYLGEARLCTGLYDDADMIIDLGSRFAQVFVRIVNRGLLRRPEWHGGAVSHWGVYAPGPLLDYQIDASSIISPKLYERNILDIDRKVLGEFKHSVTHLHACGLHLTEIIAATEEFDALEVTLERETGVWQPDRILETCRTFLDAGKGVIINGELDRRERDRFVESLNPRRLAIFYWPPGAND